MKTPLFALLCWVLATPGVAGPASPVQPQKNWLQLRSPNFTVVGDAGAGDIRRVAERLERFRDALGSLFPSAIQAASRATTVVVFRSQRSFEPFKPRYEGKPQAVSGYFTPGEAVHFIALTGDGGDEAFGIIYHEYVHAVVNAVVSSPPVWFNEGLAEYYRTLEVTNNGRQALIGRLQLDHVLRLRTEWLPLEAVLAVAHDSPLYNERNKASVFYAEAWALTHYLLLAEKGALREAGWPLRRPVDGGCGSGPGLLEGVWHVAGRPGEAPAVVCQPGHTPPDDARDVQPTHRYP